MILSRDDIASLSQDYYLIVSPPPCQHSIKSAQNHGRHFATIDTMDTMTTDANVPLPLQDSSWGTLMLPVVTRQRRRNKHSRVAILLEATAATHRSNELHVSLPGLVHTVLPLFGQIGTSPCSSGSSSTWTPPWARSVRRASCVGRIRRATAWRHSRVQLDLDPRSLSAARCPGQARLGPVVISWRCRVERQVTATSSDALGSGRL